MKELELDFKEYEYFENIWVVRGSKLRVFFVDGRYDLLIFFNRNIKIRFYGSILCLSNDWFFS